MGFLCPIRHRLCHCRGVSEFHRPERFFQCIEGGVHTFLAATVGFVVRVGGDEAEQFVDSSALAVRTAPSLELVHPEYETLAFQVEEHQLPQGSGQIVAQ